MKTRSKVHNQRLSVGNLPARAPMATARKKPRAVRAPKAPFAWRKLLGVFYRLVFLALVGLIGFYGYRAVKAYQLEYMSIQNIEIQGAPQSSTHPDIARIASSLRDKRFTDVNIGTLRDSLMQLGFIKRVDIRKQWPDTLVIGVQEYQGAARWQSLQGVSALISREGERFDKPDADASHLPLLMGEDKSMARIIKAYATLAPIFQASGQTLASMRLEPRNEWQITTASGIQILFLQRNQAEIAARLGLAFDVLHDDLAQVARIDMRYSHGFAVTTKEQINE